MSIENPVGAGRLVITFHKAVELRKHGLFANDPIILFHLDTENAEYPHKSNVCKDGGQHPEWNFPYVFDLKGNEHALIVDVRHQGIGHPELGKVEIPLIELIQHPHLTNYGLRYKDESAGEIIISTTWQPGFQAD